MTYIEMLLRDLQNLSISERDRALCALPSLTWDALARALKITLPLHGGDKPLILNRAIMALPR